LRKYLKSRENKYRWRVKHDKTETNILNDEEVTYKCEYIDNILIMAPITESVNVVQRQDIIEQSETQFGRTSFLEKLSLLYKRKKVIV